MRLFEWILLLGVVAIFLTIPYVTDHNFTDKTSYNRDISKHTHLKHNESTFGKALVPCIMHSEVAVTRPLA